MNKKNLIFGALLISILLISVVSAGITGYLTARQSISDSGITATLQGVDRTGTAVVKVENTRTGATENVQVSEGGSATTSEGVVIQASNLRQGTLLRRDRAQITVVTPSEEAESETSQECEKYSLKIDSTIFSSFGNKITLLQTEPILVVSIDGQEYQPTKGKTFDLLSGETAAIEEINSEKTAVIKICHGAGSGGATATHTHLSDPYIQNTEFYMDPAQTQAALGGNQMSIPDYFGTGKGTISIGDRNWYDEVSSTWKTTKMKQLDLSVFCNKNAKFDLAVGGMYTLGLDYTNDVEYQIIKEGVNNVNPQVGGNTFGEYLLTVQEPYTDINNDNIDDEGIQKIDMQVTCARIEPTLHQFNQDY